jgi:uncharacterized paraquat-inducible protein A
MNLEEEKIYCKKCGAWVVPENGECPRCGYVFERKNNKTKLAVLLIAIIVFLAWVLL